MAKLHDLPKSAQDVMTAIGGGQKTVYQLVDELGWSQTEAQKWLNLLEDSNWIVSRVVPEGNPAGGSAPAYRRKETA